MVCGRVAASRLMRLNTVPKDRLLLKRYTIGVLKIFFEMFQYVSILRIMIRSASEH